MHRTTSASPDDLVSLVLGTLRTDRAVTARFSLTAPWALHSEGVEGLLLRVCTGQPYWIQMDGQAAVQVQPGDIVMLPQGGPHLVASAPGLEAVPFRTLLQQHMRGAHGDHPITFAHGGEGDGTGGGAVTELFSLHLWMPRHQGASLLSWMPPLIVLRAADIATTRSLALTTGALVDETIAQRPGWQLATARMADLLLVHVLREHLHSGPAGAQGWLNGVRDKAIGKALAQMHAHPELPWSVASLSRVSNQSRSVFSERFVELMGSTPLRYLTAVRMGIAHQQFLQGADDVWRVAQAVGYSSEKAFSRAFERWSGATPSQCIKTRTIGTQIRRPEG